MCGSCTICQLCPPCTPHLHVSPKCECHENLNNCNCNCITHTHLEEYHKQWTLHLMANQNNSHAAQMNSNKLKRHLLFWLIGMSFFNVSLLFIVVLLIVFAPALLQRCAVWKSTSKLHRRQVLMKKHNLIEQPLCSTIDISPSRPLPDASHTSDLDLVLITPSYAELSQQLAAQTRLALHLTHTLPPEHERRQSTAPSAPPPKIL